MTCRIISGKSSNATLLCVLMMQCKTRTSHNNDSTQRFGSTFMVMETWLGIYGSLCIRRNHTMTFLNQHDIYNSGFPVNLPYLLNPNFPQDYDKHFVLCDNITMKLLKQTYISQPSPVSGGTIFFNLLHV